MIGLRGPHKILVVDRTVVPVSDLVSATIHNEMLDAVKQKLPVTTQEYFEAMDIFVDNYGPTENDFVEIECINNNGDIAVETVGISDWVYIACIVTGRDVLPECDNFFDLYACGIENVMMDCLLDYRDGVDHYLGSELHKLVFESFIRAYGPIGDEVDTLIGSLMESREDLEGEQ